MKIIKKVLIKQVITDKSKEKLKQGFHDEQMQLEQECQQLLFEQRKVEKRMKVFTSHVKNRFTEEVDKRKQRIKQLSFKIDQLEKIPIGTEITEREVESLVEVKEGMHWNELMRTGTIIFKDDVVIRIEE